MKDLVRSREVVGDVRKGTTGRPKNRRRFWEGILDEQWAVIVKVEGVEGDKVFSGMEYRAGRDGRDRGREEKKREEVQEGEQTRREREERRDNQ